MHGPGIVRTERGGPTFHQGMQLARIPVAEIAAIDHDAETSLAQGVDAVAPRIFAGAGENEVESLEFLADLHRVQGAMQRWIIRVADFARIARAKRPQLRDIERLGGEHRVPFRQ